jgi:ParB-like chromosome segregation protein Spo0J
MKWTLKTLSIGDIVDHPDNTQIYGTEEVGDLIESIREHGLLQPLGVFYDTAGCRFVCLSGHRRLRAAKEVGLAEVPALVGPDDLPEHEQIIEIVEANRARLKTKIILGLEASALLEAVKKRAEYRQKLGKKCESDLGEKVSQGTRKRAKKAIEEVAETLKTGSAPTTAKLIEVTDIYKELDRTGRKQEAAELAKTLNEGTVAAAHRKAVAAKEPQKPKPADDKPEEKPTGPVVVDDFSKPVPESLHPAFANRKATLALLRELTTLRKAVEERSQQPGGDLLPMFDISEKFKDLRIALKMNIPYTECFRCQRNVQKGCKLCQGRGWISEGEYNRNKTEGGTRWLENR